MAKFVESAILKIIDQSSRNLNKIERSMRSFRAEANRLKKLSFNLNSAAIRAATRDINSASTAAKRLNTQMRQLANNRVNLRGVGGGGIGGGGSGGGRRFNSGAGGGTFRINAGALDIWAAGFINRLGSTIESAIVNGFRNGARSADIADSRFRELGLNQTQRANARLNAQSISGQFPVLSQADAERLIGDSLPTTRGNLDTATALTRELGKIITAQVRRGISLEQATGDAINLVKAAESSGNVTDANGVFDPERARRFFDLLNKAFIEAGEDMSASLIRNFTKSLRTSRFSLDERGWAAGLLMAEEQGSTAGVGINQAITQLTGTRIQKKQLGNLIDLGLITEGQARAGKLGDKTLTELIGNGAVDESQLRSNMLQWTIDKLIPKMRQLGLDPNNTTDVSKFSSMIASDRTAISAISEFINRSQELASQVDQLLARNVSPEAENERNANSSLVAWQSMVSQSTSALGQFASKLEVVVIPALNTVSDWMRQLSNFIANDDSGRAAGVVAGGGVAAGITALWAGKSLTKILASPVIFATSLDKATGSVARFAAALDASGAIPGVDGPGKPRKGKLPFAPIGPTATTAVVGLGIATEAAILNYGKERIEAQPRHADDIARFEKWRSGVSDWLKNLGSALPSGNMPEQPAGMTNAPFDWKRFFIGDAANPDFQLKDALGIQTGVEMGSERLRSTFEEGSNMIGSKGPELAAGVQDALMAVAGPFGAAIAASMQSNFTPPPLSVNVNSAPSVDTGANPNNAR
jgi:hypothetical protein